MESINYIDIDWPDLLKPIASCKTEVFNRIRINREIIPIIFVPGIMGSRLKNTKTGENVWDPDREIMCMLRKFGGFWNTPAQRKRMLIGDKFNPNHLYVNDRDESHNKRFKSVDDPSRADRGWGGVYWASYGHVLQKLQCCQWDKPMNLDRNRGRNELAGKCFEFPVHAFGYNWTDSNDNSGKKLAEEIEAIKARYKSRGRLCKYVILVSHSMGGLVCRSACNLHGADAGVLGVIHGVQPATGTAAAYWRMKAGFERTGESFFERIKSAVSAWVLGTNGEEVTCILGNAPGGLELLPNQHYTNNKGESRWLNVPGKGAEKYKFPRNGNPYEEIYRVKGNAFWRLINPDWLEPRDKLSKPEDPTEHAQGAWNSYIDNINIAERFHETLQKNCHPNTYQFYSTGLDTADEVTFSQENLTFVANNYEVQTESAYSNGVDVNIEEPAIQASSRGTCVMYVDEIGREIKSPLPKPQKTHVLSMAQITNYDGGGDGTVPESSGNALSVMRSYKLEGVGHQDAYADQNTINFVITAIRNLALKRIKEGEVQSAK